MPTLRAVDDRIVPAAGTGARRRAGPPRGAGGAASGSGCCRRCASGRRGRSARRWIGAGWSPAGAVLARVCVAAPRAHRARAARAARPLAAAAAVLADGRRLRPGRRGRLPGLLLQRDRADGRRHLDPARVPGHRLRRRVAVGAARAAAPAADRAWRGGGARRPRADARPVRVRAASASPGCCSRWRRRSRWRSTSSSRRRPPPPTAGDALPPVALTWGGMVTGAAAIALLGAARVMPLRFGAAAVSLLNDRR